MKVAFRVDSSRQIGTGHFMRCLTLADMLRLQGVQIHFVSRFIPEYLQGVLAEKGHHLMRLMPKPGEEPEDELLPACWLGTSQHIDAQETIQALFDQDWDWLVVDHYALDVKWESALRQSAKNILVIDDLADRQHDCDILLDQNYYPDMEERYSGKVPPYCRKLIGPKFALLRNEFKEMRNKIVPRNGIVKRVLVFFGGVDVNNVTGRIVNLLPMLDINGAEVDVVIGSQHPQREKIKATCAKKQYHCYVQTQNMAELMSTADLAIGGGGSASWERCCLGVPAVIISLADNQVAIAKGVESLGAGVYLGADGLLDDNRICDEINKVLNNQRELCDYSTTAYSVVDGLGVERVCSELIA